MPSVQPSPTAHGGEPPPVVGSHEDAGFADLFSGEFLPVIRQLGERPRGVTAPIDDEDAVTRDAVWQGLAGLGALALDGLDGAGTLPRLRPALPLAELMGRALYQSPYFDTLMAADVVAAAETGMRAELLASIACGDLTVALAARDDAHDDLSSGGPLRLDVRPGRITAARRFVAFAPDVDCLLLVGHEGGSEDTVVALVATQQDGVLVRRQDDVGRGDLYAVTLEDAAAVDLRPRGGSWRAPWATALSRARLRHASYLVGLCLGGLELSVAYARRRQVFGQALAKFQGPAFRLAELAARTEAVRTLVHQSCAAADEGADVALPACQALMLAAELATDTGAEAIQIHGSLGLTMSCDAQRFYRRAMVDGMLLGTPRQLRREALELLTKRSADR